MPVVIELRRPESSCVCGRYLAVSQRWTARVTRMAMPKNTIAEKAAAKEKVTSPMVKPKIAAFRE